jgi:DMSO/TMAO reductase YedYZ heme-binding membrane subunit
VLHFLLLVKADRRRPLFYGAIVLLLLVVRIPFVRDALASIQKR